MILSFVISFSWPEGHPDELVQSKIIEAVNKVMEIGCYCGRKYMLPADKVVWNEVLYKSAYSHANEMNEYNFFAHFSKEGLDIGARLDRSGYNWLVAGENLGEGQKSFDEVLNDWIKSYSHCVMLMNPKVNEMAVAKVDKYWVQHFGKQMPSKKGK